VPVDCYFVGCKTAPAEYFHVLIAKQQFIAPCVTVVGVTLLALLFLQFRPNSLKSVIVSRKARLVFSGVLSLALPVPVGPQIVLFGTAIAYVPWQLQAGGDNIVVAIASVMSFAMCCCVVYAAVTIGSWLRTRFVFENRT
jgi:hypothetical protein